MESGSNLKDDSQRADVLKHLQKNGSITSIQAFEKYGVTRLSALIFILKHRYGYQIESERMNVKNRHGNICHPKRYKLVKKG